MSELDYSDSVTIKIIKVKYDTDPSHWELDVRYAGQEFEDSSGGTGPTFADVFDMAYSIIAGGDKHNGYEWNEWAKFDANERDK